MIKLTAAQIKTMLYIEAEITANPEVKTETGFQYCVMWKNKHAGVMSVLRHHDLIKSWTNWTVVCAGLTSAGKKWLREYHAAEVKQEQDMSAEPQQESTITAAGRQYVAAHPFDVDEAVRRIAAKDEQQTVKRSRRSEHEIAELKASWLGDPCWDIEDTEGFEAHHDELEAYHQEQRKLWNEASDTKLKTRAQELGCTPELAAYIQRLEQRIAILEQAMIEIESKR